MRTPLIRWVAVAALTFVLGGHWVVLQSVAWVTMAAGYARYEPLKSALIKTFDGRHPCGICKFVNEGRKSERKHDVSGPLVKLDLFLVDHSFTLDPPVIPPARCRHTAGFAYFPAKPPTPPPRAV